MRSEEKGDRIHRDWGVEANGSSSVEVTEGDEGNFVRDGDGRLQDSKVGFRQPTAEEVFRLTFGKLREIRIHAQEPHNHFARLLNRGSSLE
jgi:hypothetical protein